MKRSKELKNLVLNEEQVEDVKNIGRGVYSPLEGFLKKDDFEKVIFEMCLSNGVVLPS